LVIYYNSDEIVFSVNSLKSDKLTLFTTKRFSPIKVEHKIPKSKTLKIVNLTYLIFIGVVFPKQLPPYNEYR